MFRFFVRLFLFLLLLVALAGGAAWWWLQTPLQLRQTPVDFRIPAGSSLRAAIGQMQAAGVAVPTWPLLALARLQGAETGIKAGSYSLNAGTTPLQLLDKLVRGKVTQGELVLIEGWTFRQWRQRLDAHPDLSHDSAGLPEAELARRLGLPGERLDGWLFPDTYLFDKHSSDLELLARARRAQQQRLDAEWAVRATNLPYRSPQEALVMASIVEKETGREADRSLVAAVFVNRLRLGMRLQTDPSVIYGLGERFDGNLRKDDLLTDTPYNTYTRAGLPPTPIAMPGLASLRAALHPASSDALYFVARGDGSSEFSRTLEEHNRAVNRYQRGKRP
ncbi:endolytic transglycosylase MltG [Dechloromonas sp. ZY10]|uniref:endolytic transglycosylase MltG n=1 Tax=Dechloromonas aquae TaxID=2664436 RepID=UPI0035272E19